MPEKPGWLEQDEYEERTRIRFNLERLVTSIGGLTGLAYATRCRAESDRKEFDAMPGGFASNRWWPPSDSERLT